MVSSQLERKIKKWSVWIPGNLGTRKRGETDLRALVVVVVVADGRPCLPHLSAAAEASEDAGAHESESDSLAFDSVNKTRILPTSQRMAGGGPVDLTTGLYGVRSSGYLPTVVPNG